jgi:hypothetical protein
MRVGVVFSNVLLNQGPDFDLSQRGAAATAQSRRLGALAQELQRPQGRTKAVTRRNERLFGGRRGDHLFAGGGDDRVFGRGQADCTCCRCAVKALHSPPASAGVRVSPPRPGVRSHRDAGASGQAPGAASWVRPAAAPRRAESDVERRPPSPLAVAYLQSDCLRPRDRQRFFLTVIVPAVLVVGAPALSVRVR